MIIAIGADHRGNECAQLLVERLERYGHTVQTWLPDDDARCDYPEPAYHVAQAIADGKADRGILLDGSGVGMCIAANKVKGIRAAPVHDEITAEISRAHVDANIICLSADLLAQRRIEQIVDLWLTVDFEAGRHARRVRKLCAIEEGEDPTHVR